MMSKAAAAKAPNVKAAKTVTAASARVTGALQAGTAKGGASKGGAKPAAGQSSKGCATKGAKLTSFSASSPPPDQAPKLAPEPAPSKFGRAVVAYNHYKSEFKIDDGGEMAWADIDEEYSISFVFKDKIQVALVTEQGEAIQVADGKFSGLADGRRYTLRVTEHPEAAAAAAAVSKAAAERNRVWREEEKRQASLGRSKVDDITNQLKALKAEDRTGHGSEEFRFLKEARDLEDCLYS